MKYVIRHKHDEPGDEPLYWNNDDGFVSADCATVFSQEERDSGDLPIGGEWEPAKLFQVRSHEPTYIICTSQVWAASQDGAGEALWRGEAEQVGEPAIGDAIGWIEKAEHWSEVDLAALPTAPPSTPPVQSPDAMALLRELVETFENNHARWARGDTYDAEDRACSEPVIARARALLTANKLAL